MLSFYVCPSALAIVLQRLDSKLLAERPLCAGLVLFLCILLLFNDDVIDFSFIFDILGLSCYHFMILRLFLVQLQPKLDKVV